MALPALFIVGAEWLSSRLLPWFFLASALVLAFLILIVLPLSFFRRLRPFAATATMIGSFVFGVTLWMWGLLLTMGLWGTWAVVIGLVMLGVGVVPIAMLATLLKGMWGVLGQLLLLTLLTFGSRLFAAWIASKAEEAEVSEDEGLSDEELEAIDKAMNLPRFGGHLR